jgi:hypothetical protein
MIKCPKCNHTLVASAVTCQFCGTDVSTVPRPPPESEKKKESYKLLSKTTLHIFYVMCGIQVCLGIFEVLLGMQIFGNPGDMMQMCYKTYGFLLTLMGLLLAFRVPAMYQVSSVFCGIEGVLGIVFMIAAPFTIQVPGLKWGVLVMGAIQMLSAGFMFYYAEETAIGTVVSG